MVFSKYVAQRWACVVAFLVVIASSATVGSDKEHHPTADVINGTYYGVHNDLYKQDFFLGIPFAQQPIGDLRLRTPQSLNASWTEPRNATEYSPSCVGYNQTVGASEACLTLNVIRPSGVVPRDKLPVAGRLYLPID